MSFLIRYLSDFLSRPVLIERSSAIPAPFFVRAQALASLADQRTEFFMVTSLPAELRAVSSPKKVSALTLMKLLLLPLTMPLPTLPALPRLLLTLSLPFSITAAEKLCAPELRYHEKEEPCAADAATDELRPAADACSAPPSKTRLLIRLSRLLIKPTEL